MLVGFQQNDLQCNKIFSESQNVIFFGFLFLQKFATLGYLFKLKSNAVNLLLTR